MKHALTSINKPHTDNIFSGKKRIEWRKRPLPKTTHYCYETKNKGGIGKVRGQFDVVQNIEFDPLNYRLYSQELIADGCVPIEDLIEYANGGVIYANVIENLKEYDKPKELSEFYQKGKNNIRFDYYYCGGCPYHDIPVSQYPCNECDGNRKYLYRPPQSWCYVEELGV